MYRTYLLAKMKSNMVRKGHTNYSRKAQSGDRNHSGASVPKHSTQYSFGQNWILSFNHKSKHELFGIAKREERDKINSGDWCRTMFFGSGYRCASRLALPRPIIYSPANNL